MKKISYLLGILGIICLVVGGYMLVNGSFDKNVDDSLENGEVETSENVLVCRNQTPVYDEYYMADTNYSLVYGYEDVEKTPTSLTSHFWIMFNDEALKDATKEEKEQAIAEIEKTECLNENKEYYGVSKSCKAKWEDDNTVVVTVAWNLDNPELDYGQNLSKKELKEMIENESEYAGFLFCK